MKKFFLQNDRVKYVLFQTGAFVSLSNPSGNGQTLGPTLSGFFASPSSGNLAVFFNALFAMAISAGAILAVIRLAYAGWLYMGSADMWGNKNEAKEIIRNAIIGLLLLLAIYIILKQINPCILNLNILQTIQNGAPGSTTCSV